MKCQVSHELKRPNVLEERTENSLAKPSVCFRFLRALHQISPSLILINWSDGRTKGVSERGTWNYMNFYDSVRSSHLSDELRSREPGDVCFVTAEGVDERTSGKKEC